MHVRSNNWRRCWRRFHNKPLLASCETYILIPERRKGVLRVRGHFSGVCSQVRRLLLRTLQHSLRRLASPGGSGV